MSRVNRLGGLFATIAVSSFVVLAACVGDDPGASSSGGSSGASSSGASSSSSSGASSTSSGSSGPGACAGNTVDACGASCTKCVAPAGGSVECLNGKCEAKCNAPTALCTDQCVDVKSSQTNCGRCGHSCNGASCVDGVCQPTQIGNDFTTVNAIASSSMGIVMAVDDKDVKRCPNANGCTAAQLVDVSTGINQTRFLTVAGGEVFFAAAPSDPWIVYHCPLAGCPGGGPVVAESKNESMGALVAGPSFVYWTRAAYCAPWTERCTPPGCTDIADVRPYTNGCPYYYTDAQNTTHESDHPTKLVSVGATKVVYGTPTVYNDSNKQLRYCTLASSCATPTEISRGTYFGVSAMTYHDGKHYVVMGSGTQGGGVVVVSTPDASPGTLTPVAGDAAGVTDIAVDASGIYWVNGTTGNVRRCAKLAGCTAGEVETLATGQAGATAIRVDDKNVYWALPTKVMRVAK